MIKKIFLIITISFEITMAQNINLAQNLYSNYEIYRENSNLNHRRFKHADILPLINEYKTAMAFFQSKRPENPLKDVIFFFYRLERENQKYSFGHKCMGMNQRQQWHFLMFLIFSMPMTVCKS